MFQNKNHVVDTNNTGQKNEREENMEEYLRIAKREAKYASIYATVGFIIFLVQFS